MIMELDLRKIKAVTAAVSVMMLCACSSGTAGQTNETQIISPDHSVSVTAATGTEERSVQEQTTAAEVPETEAQAEDTEPLPAETEPAPIPKVTFTAVGDNLIHSSIYKQAARRAESVDGMDYDFSFAYANVADLLDKADISVINQETLICNDEYEPDTYPTFNSPMELGDHMSRLGFDVFGMANNHVLDKGADGLDACLRYYDRRKYIRVGAYHDERDRNNIRIVEKNGMKVAFLAYTESFNGLRLPSDSLMTVGSIANEEAIDLALKEVTRAAGMSDAVVLLLHWGVEDSDIISDSQRTLALKFADAGADVILGTHPHVLRDIEWIGRRDGGSTLCAYSLGNFISAQNVGRNLIGGILDFELDLDGERPSVTMISFIPVITHYDASYSDIRLYPLSDYSEELASRHGVRANSEFSYEFIYNYLSKHHLLAEQGSIVNRYSQEEDQEGADT